MLTKLPKILCVDDERVIRESMTVSLQRRYQVLTASDGPSALALLHANPDVAVIISDMRMPNMDGATFFSLARKVRPMAIRIVLSGQADLESTVRAINNGSVFRFIMKPCAVGVLLATLEAAMEHYGKAHVA